MHLSTTATLRRPPLLPGGFDAIRLNLATAMIGQTVDLLADAQLITRGIVAGVITEAGTPKLVVDHRTYHLKQVLTVAPTPLN